MTNEEQDKKLGQIIAKATEDEAFKQRLLADATTVLKEEGVALPDGLKIKAVEDTDKVMHIVLPPAPGEFALSDVQLEAVSGGFIFKNH